MCSPRPTSTAAAVSNTATATGSSPAEALSAQAELTTGITQVPHLTVGKTAAAPPVVNAGDTIIYTVTVLNDGNTTISPPTVTDPMCTLTFGSGDIDNDNRLDVGETWVYTCSYVVTDADVLVGSITNTVTVTASSGPLAVAGSATVTVAVGGVPPTTNPPTPPTTAPPTFPGLFR